MSTKSKDSHIAAILAAKEQLDNTREHDGHKLIKRLFSVPKHIKRNISLALNGQTITGFDDISLKVKNAQIIASIHDETKINQLIGSFIAIKWIIKSLSQENLLTTLEIDRLLIELKVVLLSFSSFSELAEILLVAFSEHVVNSLLQKNGDKTNNSELIVYALLELGLNYQKCSEIGEAISSMQSAATDEENENLYPSWTNHLKALKDLGSEITPATWIHFGLNSLEARTEYDDNVNNIKKRGHMWQWLMPS